MFGYLFPAGQYRGAIKLPHLSETLWPMMHLQEYSPNVQTLWVFPHDDMTDSTGSILLDDMNFGTSKIVPQLSQSGDVVLVKHLFLETLSNLKWFKVYCLITYMFPRKKSQRFSSLANTSYPRTPTGQSLPAKNQSFWGLVMWRYKVFQRDFAMSGVSQEEMDSCVLIIWIDLYEYIYIYIYAWCYLYIA